MPRCNTCNVEFDHWMKGVDGPICPACENTKQMSDEVEEFRGQTEASRRACDFCGQDYSFKDTKANICPACKEEALAGSEYLLSRTDVAEKIARQTLPPADSGYGGVPVPGAPQKICKKCKAPFHTWTGADYCLDCNTANKKVIELSMGEAPGGVIEELVKELQAGNITRMRVVDSSEVEILHPFTFITSEMYHLYLKKNHDYGNSFSDQFQDLGMASSIIRLSDKLSRLKSLHGKPQQVADESIRDTLIDLANYAVMTIMELDRESKEVGR